MLRVLYMLDYSFSLGVALATLAICAVNLIYTVILGRTDKTQNKIFITILCILMIDAATNIITGYYGSISFQSEHAATMVYISIYAYFVTHTALCPMFYYYVSNISFVSTRLSNLKTRIIAVPFVITEVMALINPIANWIWSMDEDLTFHREWGEMLIYIAALIYYVLAFIVFIKSWSVISKKRKTALVFFFVLVVIGVMIQLINVNLKVEVLAESIGMTGAMMLIENEDDRMDFGMGFYNRTALSLDISGCLRHNRHLSVIVIKINNYDIIDRLVGNEESHVISDIISDYLKQLVKRYYIYVPSLDTFVLTVYGRNQEKAEALADELSNRLARPWDYKNYNIQLNATIMYAFIPEQIKSTAEMFYMIDCPTPKDSAKKVLKGDSLNYIMRRQAIVGAISRGFTENSYEVYYQPTYHLDGTLHGAEALIRMHDKELGNLYPDEFIPVAEQTGLIDDIDDFVLEEVCKFLKTGISEKYGIDNINVNLSVLQCMRPGFVDNVNRIVDKYGISKKMINFEITESIAADDYGTLGDVIKQLKQGGFMFSMDDYGTGYSNVSAVFSLNLDVVKIDKSLLWCAEKSELGMIILENTIRMIQQMKKLILVEGVETVDQINLLKKLNVDYLQGFYFSKPIPKDEFVKLISRYRKK